MSSEKRSKINRLLKNWPHGTVGVLCWLETKGVYQQLAIAYERSGWLRRIGRGAYVRQDDKVDWLGGVYALQKQLKLLVHVGGKTALELRGFAHFLPLGEGGYLYIFGRPEEKLPLWFQRHDWKHKIDYKVPLLFGSKDTMGLTHHSLGSFDILISSPERAILEVLHLSPSEQSLEEALLLMEGLATLRPNLVQQLLEQCRSIKVKRLFLYLAERCQHEWLKKLNFKKISLGKGKRMVVKKGHLDLKYQITVPWLKEKEDAGSQS